MDLRVQGMSPDPFLGAADLFETEWSLDDPVHVKVREDPDERTWAGHYDGYHVLNVSKRAATSAMARELAVHELSHMARYEEGHASHVQSTEEALYLGLSGETVERRKLAHCYQIANHMKDIYADDITLSVAPADKLLGFLESTLAAAVADRPEVSRDGARRSRPARTQRSPRSTPHSRSPSSSATTSPARTTVSTTSRVRPAATPTPSTSTRSRSGSSRSAPTLRERLPEGARRGRPRVRGLKVKTR